MRATKTLPEAFLGLLENARLPDAKEHRVHAATAAPSLRHHDASRLQEAVSTQGRRVKTMIRSTSRVWSE